MARTKDKPLSRQTSAVNNETTVKFPRDLARMAATIAAHAGVGISAVLDGLVRQPLTEAHERMGREIAAASKGGK